MCGLSGFLGFDGLPRSAEAIAQRMAARLSHRGPDDSGVWVDADAGIALSHRRLSIVDLSPHGAQPMVSHCGRFVLVYNGEIYNHLELRADLQRQWRGHCDSETLLEAIAQWGVDPALRRCAGMFAFALWDRHERTLHLARDRLGEKPLYYGLVGRSLVFASELSALHEFPEFRPSIDRDSLALLTTYNCIPAPRSIYRDIGKLPPGTVLSISATAAQRRSLPMPQPYWSAAEESVRGLHAPLPGTADEICDQLEAVLMNVVGQQMLADVPLGAFLSGGVDSSVIVAMMQKHAVSPVRTFSVGFAESGFDEAAHAKAVAAHLGTTHTELYVTPRDALEVVARLPRIYDEPFSDSSQLPTYLLCAMARQHVTVALSGDGGDEVFGGYNRYMWVNSIWRRLRYAPAAVRRSGAAMLARVGSENWQRAYAFASSVIPGLTRQQAGLKVQKILEIADAESPAAIYHRLTSHRGPAEEALVLGAGTRLPVARLDERLPTIEEQMMLADSLHYLPDDILVKVDRASMAVSLESRTPFIDHRVFEFAWRVPLSMKIHGGTGKWLLRRLLYRHVPQQLIDRPKMGFAVPVAEWLRGPLRDWAESLLDARRLREESYFDVTMVRRLWQEHLQGTHDQHRVLWDVLMFQAWLSGQPAAA